MADRSADKMVSILLNEPEIMEGIKQDPQKALKILKNAANEAKAETPAYYKDEWVYRIVVGALGLAVLIAAVGAIVLVTNDKTAPDILVALGSGAVGALAGLLAPSPVSGK